MLNAQFQTDLCTSDLTNSGGYSIRTRFSALPLVACALDSRGLLCDGEAMGNAGEGGRAGRAGATIPSPGKV